MHLNRVLFSLLYELHCSLGILGLRVAVGDQAERREISSFVLMQFGIAGFLNIECSHEYFESVVVAGDFEVAFAEGGEDVCVV